MILFGFLVLGFIAMEIVSYLIHRFLFHGLLWKIHKTHHTHHHGVFELNDIFSLLFASLSICLIWIGASEKWVLPYFGLGLGVAAYGILYFFIHDVIAHKRFFKLKARSPFVRLLKRAHNNHHQDVGKAGQEPYGLFLFPYDKYPEKKGK